MRLRGILGYETVKERRVGCRGDAHEADITVETYGLVLYGNCASKRQQTYMEIGYKGTKRIYEIYYQQSRKGIWKFKQAVNKNGEVFDAEDLFNECVVLPGNERTIELTTDGLSKWYSGLSYQR